MPDSVLGWNRKDGWVTGGALRSCCTLGLGGSVRVLALLCLSVPREIGQTGGVGIYVLARQWQIEKGMERVKSRKTECRLAFFSAFPSTQTLLVPLPTGSRATPSLWAEFSPAVFGLTYTVCSSFIWRLATNIEIGGDFTENFGGREMRPESAEVRFPNSPKAQKSNSTPLGWSGGGPFSFISQSLPPPVVPWSSAGGQVIMAGLSRLC